MQGCMQSSLQNYIHRVFDKVKQSTKAFQLKVEGDIASLGLALAQDIRNMCAQITERLYSVRRNVSNSVHGPIFGMTNHYEVVTGIIQAWVVLTQIRHFSRRRVFHFSDIFPIALDELLRNVLGRFKASRHLAFYHTISPLTSIGRHCRSVSRYDTQYIPAVDNSYLFSTAGSH